MKCQSLLALVASISLIQGSCLAYTLRHHHHHHVRSWQPPTERRLEQREAAKVSTGQLQQLQQRVETYNSWLTYYTDSHPGNASGPFQQEFQAFEGLVNGWVQASTDISSAQLSDLEQHVQAYNQSVSTYIATRPPKEDGTVQLHQQYQAFQGWIEDWLATSTGTRPSDSHTESAPAVPSPKESGSATTSESEYPGKENVAPVPAAQPSPEQSAPAPESSGGNSDTVPVKSGAAPVKTDSTPDPKPETSIKHSENDSSDTNNTQQSYAPPDTQTASPPATGGNFNAQSKSNVVVYWGGAAEASEVGLMDLCTDPSVDIINLAFLLSFNDGGYPKIDFSSGCGGQSSLQQQRAPGLMRCTQMEDAIKTCQSGGKKVFISIGGALGSEGINLGSEQDADDAASKIWDIFGGGTGADKDLRPFGDVKLDGFDIDNENKKPQYYTNFISALRQKMNSDSSKKYYLSAAPQCPIPDESIPLEVMQTIDYVWVQFYNNPGCNLDSPGFSASFKQWSSDLSKGGKGPQLLVGAPGCPVPQCSGSAYVDGEALKPILDGVKTASNFGGVMLWEGSRAKKNNDFIKTVKGLLG